MEKKKKKVLRADNEPINTLGKKKSTMTSTANPPVKKTKHMHHHNLGPGHTMIISNNPVESFIISDWANLGAVQHMHHSHRSVL